MIGQKLCEPMYMRNIILENLIGGGLFVLNDL